MASQRGFPAFNCYLIIGVRCSACRSVLRCVSVCDRVTLCVAQIAMRHCEFLGCWSGRRHRENVRASATIIMGRKAHATTESEHSVRVGGMGFPAHDDH